MSLDTLYAQPPTTTRNYRRGPSSDPTRLSSSDASARVDSPPVTTRRATQPGRLAPYPSLFSLIIFRRFSSACFHRRRTNIDRVEQIDRIETSEVSVKSNTERELQPTATPRRATPLLRTWIERVLPYPSSRVFPGHPVLALLIGTPACT